MEYNIRFISWDKFKNSITDIMHGYYTCIFGSKKYNAIGVFQGKRRKLLVAKLYLVAKFGVLATNHSMIELILNIHFNAFTVVGTPGLPFDLKN